MCIQNCEQSAKNIGELFQIVLTAVVTIYFTLVVCPGTIDTFFDNVGVYRTIFAGNRYKPSFHSYVCYSTMYNLYLFTLCNTILF